MKKNKINLNFSDGLETGAFIGIGCGAILLALLLWVAGLFITPLLLMFLWNTCLVALFPALPVIGGYWIAFGINLLLVIVGKAFKSIVIGSRFKND